MRTLSIRLTLASAGLAAACHGGSPAEAPTPQPSQAELATRQRVQDSLAAVQRFSADSTERVRLLAAATQARADSVDRARLAVEAAAREAEAELARKSNALRTELGSVVLFDPASATVTPDAMLLLDRKVAILDANRSVRLQVTGACDERGSERYNLALGQRRAAAVARYLIGKGVDASRLDQLSSGEGSPIDSGSGEPAWARNRRADFAIIGGSATLAMQ